jgi:hypothetical protein
VTALLEALTAGPTEAPHGPGQILATLGLTLALALIIGSTYQRTGSGGFYTQGFVQTLVLVSMVASLVLQIVSKNVAAAFAIFGAFSIIRYRSTVPETRDVGFIFFVMAVGLATGAGLALLAAIATGAICLTIYAMWRLNLFAPARSSHLLRIRVASDVTLAGLFEDVFARYLEDSTLLRVESVQGGLLTEVSYAVRLKEDADPQGLVAELQRLTGNQRVVLVASGGDANL